MKKISITIIASLFVMLAFCQNDQQSVQPSNSRSHSDSKFRISTTWLSFANFGKEQTNTQHYELHLKYNLTPKNIIGVKAATWKLFATMGMPMAEQLKFDENNFYPGRLRESGVGLTYQRMLWKGLFATIEVLPQFQTYLDQEKRIIQRGFKLYSSYHVGYHVSFLKDRLFIEPQIHCQYWPIDTNTPLAFKQMDDQWNKYFLFEPNLYFGIKF